MNWATQSSFQVLKIYSNLSSGLVMIALLLLNILAFLETPNQVDYTGFPRVCKTIQLIVLSPGKSEHPKLERKDPVLLLLLMLRLPHLDSETGWTGELWSKTNVLKKQNYEDRIFFFFFKKKYFQNFQIFWREKIPHTGDTNSLDLCGQQDRYKFEEVA